MISLTAILGPPARRPRHVHRLAGPEAAGHRRGRRDARRHAPGAIPDPRPLHLLPGPGRPGPGRARRRRQAGPTRRRVAWTMTPRAVAVRELDDTHGFHKGNFMIRHGKRLCFLLALVGAGTYTAANRSASSVVQRAWKSVRSGAVSAAVRPVARRDPSRRATSKARGTGRSRSTIGRSPPWGSGPSRSSPRSSPLMLELLGTTAHDPDSLVKVRPRFDSLVSKVHATLGQTVQKGDPLIDLYSAQLAEAKSVYEEKLAQWDHDRRQLERHRELAQAEGDRQQAVSRHGERRAEEPRGVQARPRQVARLRARRRRDRGHPAGGRLAEGADDAPRFERRSRDRARRRPRQPLRRDQHPDGHRPPGPPLGLGQRLRERHRQGRGWAKSWRSSSPTSTGGSRGRSTTSPTRSIPGRTPSGSAPRSPTPRDD